MGQLGAPLSPKNLATSGDERFDVIWNCIKNWEINVPRFPSAAHVQAILDALDAKKMAEEKRLRDLVEKAVNKWNGDLEYIEAQVKSMNEDPARLGKVYSGHFCWSQMVWQECRMYAQLGAPVSVQEFNWLCKTRGFTTEQREYLKAMINHLELGWGETNTEEKQFYEKYTAVDKEIMYSEKSGR